MTIPTPAQFTFVSERDVRHEPTETTLHFPRQQSWRGNGFSICSVGPGKTDTLLPNGERYALRDIIEAARKLMVARALAKAS